LRTTRASSAAARSANEQRETEVSLRNLLSFGDLTIAPVPRRIESQTGEKLSVYGFKSYPESVNAAVRSHVVRYVAHGSVTTTPPATLKDGGDHGEGTSVENF